MSKFTQRLVLTGDVFLDVAGQEVKVTESQLAIFDGDQRLVKLLGSGFPKFAARQVAKELTLKGRKS